MIEKGENWVIVDTKYRHYELLALYVSNSDSSAKLLGGALPILQLWADDTQDVAILRVQLPRSIGTGEPLRLRSTILGARPPKQGNPVVAMGYHKMAAGRLRDGRVQYTQETAISTGRVIEVFHERRDTILANYPCFHVEGRFDSGMSGGPIFDDRGRVCGIVSRGLESLEGEYTGVGASIWPALAIPIQVNVDGTVETTTLLELARRNVVDLDESDVRLQVVDGEVSIYYDSNEP